MAYFVKYFIKSTTVRTDLAADFTENKEQTHLSQYVAETCDFGVGTDD
jgi:hypothetical protein